MAAALGYECVELMCWPAGKAERRYAGVTHIEVDSLDNEAVERVQGLSGESGVSISGLGYYPNPLSPDFGGAERAVDHIRKVIVAAQHAGDPADEHLRRAGLDQVGGRQLAAVPGSLGPLVQCADDHGVRIGIENCPMFFTGDEWPGGKNLAISPAIWRRMFDDIPSESFGLNYDPSHMVFQQMDYLAPLREFRDRIHHVHAKDVRVDYHRLNDVGILATPLEYHTPKLPGLGDVDWGSYFSTLNDIGLSGTGLRGSGRPRLRGFAGIPQGGAAAKPDITCATSSRVS